jgi:hypothetical protein
MVDWKSKYLEMKLKYIHLKGGTAILSPYGRIKQGGGGGLGVANKTAHGVLSVEELGNELSDLGMPDADIESLFFRQAPTKLNYTKEEAAAIFKNKVIDRVSLYIAWRDKEPKYDNIDYLLNGINVGKLIDAKVDSGHGGGDRLVHFEFEDSAGNKTNNTEDLMNRDKHKIIPIFNI